MGILAYSLAVVTHSQIVLSVTADSLMMSDLCEYHTKRRKASNSRRSSRKVNVLEPRKWAVIDLWVLHACLIIFESSEMPEMGKWRVSIGEDMTSCKIRLSRRKLVSGQLK